jgi:hypothetical protein
VPTRRSPAAAGPSGYLFEGATRIELVLSDVEHTEVHDEWTQYSTMWASDALLLVNDVALYEPNDTTTFWLDDSFALQCSCTAKTVSCRLYRQ